MFKLKDGIRRLKLRIYRRFGRAQLGAKFATIRFPWNNCDHLTIGSDVER